MTIKLDRRFFSESLNTSADRLEAKALEALHSLKTKQCTGREWTGWFNWPKERGLALAHEIRTWQNSFKEPYDLVVVIGIGGSYLGAKAVADLTSHSFAPAFTGANSKRIPIAFAGQNMSEYALADLLELMGSKSPVINVISKSGTTTEPGVAFRVVRSWMEKRYGKDAAARRIIATTDAKKGALRKLAEQVGYKTFEVPDDVGGRYSVLTAVGLVPLALSGIDIAGLLSGASRTFDEFQAEAPKGVGRVGLEYAMCRTAAFNAGKVLEVVSYPEPRMRNLVEWFKQLFGESDGKKGLGLFPASLECTMDLHSLGQYMQDGVRSMTETFLAVDKPRGDRPSVTVPTLNSDIDELQYLEGQGLDHVNNMAMLATRLAHADGGVPCLELRLADLSPETVGSLFAMYETSCAVGGLMLGINPFDQPGVEAYKVNLFGLLGKPGFEAAKAKLSSRL